MKPLLFFILLVPFTSPIFAQLNMGFYFSFQQITNNTPTRNDSATVKERSNDDIVMLGGGKYTFELASKDKAEFKKIRKEFVGFSDGKNFYISDKFTVGGWQGMTLCVLSGPYIIAPIKGGAGQYTGGGIIPTMIKVGSGFLINTNTGISTKLSKKILKELLANYPDIADEYEGESDLMDFAVEIIDKINKKEKH